MGQWTRARGCSLLWTLCGRCACVIYSVCPCICLSTGEGVGAQWCIAGVDSCCQNVCWIKNPFRQHNSTNVSLLFWLQLHGKHHWRCFITVKNIVHIVKIHTFNLIHWMCLHGFWNQGNMILWRLSRILCAPDCCIYSECAFVCPCVFSSTLQVKSLYDLWTLSTLNAGEIKQTKQTRPLFE